MKKKRVVNYREGDLFAVPLRPSGYAIGLVARASSEGILLGYFFGPLRSTLPQLSELHALSADKAIYIHLFGDLGLRNGDWPTLGRLDKWDRSDWPMPLFVRFSPISGKPRVLVEYSDEDPATELAEHPIMGTATGLPKDGIDGFVATEIWLSKLLGTPHGHHDP